MSDVFVSHAWKDCADIAGTLVSRLESHSVRCWIAPRDVRPGEPYSSQIVEAIQASRLLVVFLTPAGSASEDVLQEVQIAHSEKKPIIPIRVALTPLGAGLRYFLEPLHRLDWESADSVDFILKKLRRKDSPSLVDLIVLAVPAEDGLSGRLNFDGWSKAVGELVRQREAVFSYSGATPSGAIKLARQVLAPMSGILVETHARAGDTVRNGQVVGTLQPASPK